MFLFDEDRAEQQVRGITCHCRLSLTHIPPVCLPLRSSFQFHYRTVMINWLFTPGMTFKDLAKASKDKWERYFNYAHAAGFGSKDASVPWSEWYF